MVRPFMGPPPISASAGFTAAPFGAPAWQTQQRPEGMQGVIPSVRMGPAGMGQQPMTPPHAGAVMGYSPHAGVQVGTPSKIDPNQIPQPVPSSSSLVYFETRQGTVVNPPPCAVLYTTVLGQRRIRVINLSLPCTTVLSNLFRSADLGLQFSCFLKQAANGIPITPLTQVGEQITSHCINILGSYRKFCASISSSGQLILPVALKLLPLYTLVLIKSVWLRNDGRLDDRSYWASHAALISTSLTGPWYIQDLSPFMTSLPSDHLSDEGVFLLENGEDALIYVGGMVYPEILQKLFGSPSLEGVPSQLVLQQFDNDLSKKLNEVVNEIRQQRCSYLRLRLCKKGEPSGMLFH